MKSLLLLRHAQAHVIAGGTNDKARALSAEGLAQGRALGAWLREAGWMVERILCSSALRAQQTAETVRVAAGWQTPVSLYEALYNAEAMAMIELLRNDAAAVERLLLVAHAPGIAQLASVLTTQRADLSLVCEPATLIEVVLDVSSWADIVPGCASLRRVLPP
jgi:phosphohistidine phosphatase